MSKVNKEIKILLVDIGWMGDTLMTTPMIRVLRSNYSDAKIDALVMFRSSYEILKNNPYLDRIIFYPFLQRGYIKSFMFIFKNLFRKYHISLTFYPAYPKHYHLVSFLINARKRIGIKFKKGYIKEFFFLYSNLYDAIESKHHVINNLKMLKGLGIEMSNVAPLKFPLEFYPDAPSINCEKICKNIGKDFIFIHNGSSSFKEGSTKRRLNKEQIITLLKSLLSKTKVAYNIGPEEREQKVWLKEEFHKIISKRLFIIEGFSLSDVAHILKSASVVISTDSGIHHLAASLKKKVILIIGPTDERKIFPWGTEYYLISANTPCRPCYVSYTQRKFSCKNFDKWACMHQIDINQIVEVTEKLIET